MGGFHEFLILIFKAVSSKVGQVGLEFEILLPQPPKVWYHKHTPSCPTRFQELILAPVSNKHVRACVQSRQARGSLLRICWGHGSAFVHHELPLLWTSFHVPQFTLRFYSLLFQAYLVGQACNDNIQEVESGEYLWVSPIWALYRTYCLKINE